MTPLNRVGDDQQLDYETGTIQASVIPHLPDDNYDDVEVEAIETTVGGASVLASPFTACCRPGEVCQDCRLTTCDPGPPPPNTNMRHLRMRRSSVAYNLTDSEIDLIDNAAGPILTFIATSIDNVLASLFDRIGGPQSGILFQIYKLASQGLGNVPGTYIAIPVPDLTPPP